jgi:sugar phosphate isomerase/epimerase
MDIALTTRWNARRHNSGESMIQEILEMGFTCVELGYDTRLDKLEGIRRRVAEKAVRVNSLHNFCPVPVSAPQAHPEIYTFAHADRRVRELAVEHTRRTIEFAAELGARVVVTHCGYVDSRVSTRDLMETFARHGLFSPAYEALKFKLQTERDKRSAPWLAMVEEALAALLPTLEQHRVALALENLPSWEAVPNEIETERLIRQFNSPWIRYWHDIGHGKIRDAMGFINVERWFDRLAPVLAGMHIHDVVDKIQDHAMPPRGEVDFSFFTPYVQADVVRVIEPRTSTPREEVVEALAYLQQTWASAPAKESAS